MRKKDRTKIRRYIIRSPSVGPLQETDQCDHTGPAMNQVSSIPEEAPDVQVLDSHLMTMADQIDEAISLLDALFPDELLAAAEELAASQAAADPPIIHPRQKRRRRIRQSRKGDQGGAKKTTAHQVAVMPSNRLQLVLPAQPSAGPLQSGAAWSPEDFPPLVGEPHSHL